MLAEEIYVQWSFLFICPIHLNKSRTYSSISSILLEMTYISHILETKKFKHPTEKGAGRNQAQFFSPPGESKLLYTVQSKYLVRAVSLKSLFKNHFEN